MAASPVHTQGQKTYFLNSFFACSLSVVEDPVFGQDKDTPVLLPRFFIATQLTGVAHDPTRRGAHGVRGLSVEHGAVIPAGSPAVQDGSAAGRPSLPRLGPRLTGRETVIGADRSEMTWE